MDSGPDYSLFPIFEPYPGTEIWQGIEKHGTFDKSGKYQNALLSENSAVWIPNGRTREELENFSAQAMMRFYLRPRQIWLGIANIFYATPARVFRYFASGLMFMANAVFGSSRGGARY